MGNVQNKYCGDKHWHSSLLQLLGVAVHQILETHTVVVKLHKLQIMMVSVYDQQTPDCICLLTYLLTHSMVQDIP